jgi:diguanylate cyclase (GGDEF)-like protein/PAS domain S-box-containing protein
MASAHEGRKADAAASTWRYWVAAAPLFTLIYFIVPREVRGWMFLALNLAAGATVLVGLRLWRPQRPAMWRLICAGLLCTGFGNLIWATYVLILGTNSAIVSIANVFFAGGYALIATGILTGLRRRDPKGFPTRLVDGLIIITGSAAWWWTVLILPVISVPGVHFIERLTSALYPTSDVALLVTLGALVVTPLRSSLSTRLVVIALGITLVSDLLYYRLALSNAFDVGGPVDFGWIIGFVCFGTAALHPSMAEDVPVESKERTLGKRRLAAFVAASLVGPATLIITKLSGERVNTWALVVPSLLLFLFTLWRMVGLLRNVEEQVDEIENQKSALEEAEARFRMLVEQIPAVTYIGALGPNLPSLYISPRLETLLGYTPEEWSRDPDNWRKHLHPEDADETMAAVANANSAAVDYSLEYRLFRRDGGVVWVRDEAMLLHDASGAPKFWQGIISDITVQKGLEEQLTHQAFHDTLTKLANRVLFSDRVDHALKRIERTDETVAVLFIDLDNFKDVNDTLGHAVGDEVLKLAAERLVACLRGSDTAARLGGDEFGVLLEDADETTACLVATRVIEALREPVTVQGTAVSIAGSIGIALGAGAEGSTHLLRNADAAMYVAKRGGRSRYVVFERHMRSNLTTRVQLHADLRSAIENGELDLHYQPVFDLTTLDPVGVEGLVRWNHPSRGLISPGDFIPLAEETGLIVPLGQFVLDRMCAQARQWEKTLQREHSLTVGVNVSVRQLQLKTFADDVAATLDRYGLPADRFVLEITETVLMSEPEDIARRLHRLAESGVLLAIDDFGAGYSSLGYLRQLPVRILKMDRSFLKGMRVGDEQQAFVEAIVMLGRSLGLDVVAEGIETQGELEAMRRIGCNFGQGFLLGRPLPADELEAHLATGATHLLGLESPS